MSVSHITVFCNLLISASNVGPALWKKTVFHQVATHVNKMKYFPTDKNVAKIDVLIRGYPLGEKGVYIFLIII